MLRRLPHAPTKRLGESTTRGIIIYRCLLDCTPNPWIIGYMSRGSEEYGSVQRMQDELAHFENGQVWSTWALTGKPFTTVYTASHDGRFPPIDPFARNIWETSRTNDISNQKEHEMGVAKGKEFSAFFNDVVLKADNDSCSEGILIYEILSGGLPVYREEELNTARLQRNVSLSGGALCSIAGCVEVTVPIEQVPFISSISLVEEMKAVTISMIARRGCDYMLLDLIKRLADEGLNQAVKTGRNAFEL